MKKIVTFFSLLLSGALLSQNPNWVLFDHTNAPFTNDSITCVKVDTNNVKWVGTRNGLFKFNNNAWTEFNTSNSNIPSNRIDKFEIAYDNTIWFTNNRNGFYKLQNNSFTLYNQTSLPALSTQAFTGLTIDSNDVFLWTANEGIVGFNSMTNTVTHINSSNSCLQNIGKLVAHGNHMIYGLVKTPDSGLGPPQTLLDSIKYLNDFTITNTPGMPINCCFNNYYSSCTYIDVETDRYGNRYEVAQLYTGAPVTNQRLRTYDKNNVLLSDIQYNQQPEYQFATNSYGYYTLTIPDVLKVSLYNPPSFNAYSPWNSIIPMGYIENFDIDTLNTIWLATSMGLVGYNDMGVITKLNEHSLNPVVSFPNPAQNEVTFTFETKTIDHVTARLFNTLGNLVKEEEIPLSGSNKAKTDVSNLPNGVYYYTLEQKDQPITKGKIIILK